eukprot:233009-Pyramimonas_sp.AAC.1
MMSLGSAVAGMGTPRSALRALGLKFRRAFSIEWNRHCQDVIRQNTHCERLHDDITKVPMSELEH